MKKRLLTRKNVSSICAVVLATAILLSYQSQVIVHAQGNATVQQENIKTPKEIVEEIRQGTRGPLYAGYYRTWQDVKSTKSKEAALEDNEPETEGTSLNGVNHMSEVPKEVDMLFVFDHYVHKESPFWKALETEYVPKLHRQGTAVVQTLGVSFLTGDVGISTDKVTYPDTEEGNRKLAKDIVKTYVTDRGLDGLDIDIEGPDYDIEKHKKFTSRASKVFKEIAKLIGKNGEDTSKLLIIDTTLPPEKNPLFTESAGSIDFLLRQYYGHQDGDGFERINKEWEQFKKYIKPQQLMIGFSFYEENSKSSLWYDVSTEDGNDITDTRAKKYAEWQPKTGGVKGGIFAYAIERDGVTHPKRGERRYFAHPSDGKKESEYKVTKALKKVMTDDERHKGITAEDIPDPYLRQEILQQVGGAKGNFELFDGTLVIDDPNITSLRGLNQFKRVKKIVIDGLNHISKLSASDLPKSIKREKGQADTILEIRNMTSLKELDLSNLNRQTLDGIEFNTLQSLVYVNLSKNAFDFSKDSKEYKTLESILNKEVIFEGQKPEGYVPSHFGNAKVRREKSETSINLINTFLTGAQTVSGRILADESSFNMMLAETIKDQTFIDQSYKFEDFKVNYDQYTVDVVDHHLVRSKEENLKLSQDAIYNITFKDPTGKEVLFEDGTNHVELTVGNGPEILEDLAVGAKVLLKTDYNAYANGLFDGKYGISESYKGHKNNDVVFELVSPGISDSWTLYRSAYSQHQDKGNDVTKASLKVLEDETKYYQLVSEKGNATAYLENKDNWKTISNFENATSDTMTLSLEGNKSRIFKVSFETSRDNYFVEVAELQIVGKRLEDFEQSKIDKAVILQAKAGELLDGLSPDLEDLREKFVTNISEISEKIRKAQNTDIVERLVKEGEAKIEEFRKQDEDNRLAKEKEQRNQEELNKQNEQQSPKEFRSLEETSGVEKTIEQEELESVTEISREETVNQEVQRKSLEQYRIDEAVKLQAEAGGFLEIFAFDSEESKDKFIKSIMEIADKIRKASNNEDVVRLAEEGRAKIKEFR